MRIEREEILAKIELLVDHFYLQGFLSHGPLALVGVLEAARWFTQDVSKVMSKRLIAHRIEWADAKSYRGTDRRAVKINSLPTLTSNHTVLLLDTICDSGATMKEVYRSLRYRHRVLTAALLTKNTIHLDYACFSLPDPSPFLIGYGLDYNGAYREQEFIAEWEGGADERSRGVQVSSG